MLYGEPRQTIECTKIAKRIRHRQNAEEAPNRIPVNILKVHAIRRHDAHRRHRTKRSYDENSVLPQKRKCAPCCYMTVAISSHDDAIMQYLLAPIICVRSSLVH